MSKIFNKKKVIKLLIYFLNFSSFSMQKKSLKKSKNGLEKYQKKYWTMTKLNFPKLYEIKYSIIKFEGCEYILKVCAVLEIIKV